MLTNNSLKLNRTNVILLKGKNIKLKTKKKKGLTLNYLGTIDNKLGMSKKIMTKDDYMKINIHNSIFHNEKLALMTKFTFPKNTFQELKLPSFTSSQNNKMGKKLEKEVVKKMDNYCMERLNGKSLGSLYNNPSINYTKNSCFFNESSRNDRLTFNTISNGIRNKSKKLYIAPIKYRLNSFDTLRRHLFEENRPLGLSQYIHKKF
jgi:hypothetical protein